MNIHVPSDFIPVNRYEFGSVLALCNWERDAYSNASVYRSLFEFIPMTFGFHMDDGTFHVNPIFSKFVEQLREKQHAT